MNPVARPLSWSAGSASEKESLALGERLGRNLIGGMVVGLIGPLGAGKTQLVKGIALGNGLDDERAVTSPTFTLVQEYSGRLRIFHVDVYRLRSPAEFSALGFDEWLQPDSVVIVEWADRVRSILPMDTLWIELAVTGEQDRVFAFQAGGPLAQRCIAALSTVPKT